MQTVLRDSGMYHLIQLLKTKQENYRKKKLNEKEKLRKAACRRALSQATKQCKIKIQQKKNSGKAEKVHRDSGIKKRERTRKCGNDSETLTCNAVVFLLLVLMVVFFSSNLQEDEH